MRRQHPPRQHPGAALKQARPPSWYQGMRKPARKRISEALPTSSAPKHRARRVLFWPRDAGGRRTSGRGALRWSPQAARNAPGAGYKVVEFNYSIYNSTSRSHTPPPREKENYKVYRRIKRGDPSCPAAQGCLPAPLSPRRWLWVRSGDARGHATPAGPGKLSQTAHAGGEGSQHAALPGQRQDTTEWSCPKSP